MSCNTSISIYGLYPETDITEIPAEEKCDWSIYARPECVTGCLYFDETEILLPFGVAGITGVDCPYEFQIEINTIMDYTTYNIPVFSEYPTTGLSSPDRIHLQARYFSVDRMLPVYAIGATTGSTSLFPPPRMDKIGEWGRYRLVSPAVCPGSWNLYYAEPTSYTPENTAVMPTAGLTVIPDYLRLGAIYIGANPYYYEGYMRNAKLIQNGVTLGDWPIINQLIVGNQITDVSGNGNHGYILQQGNGVWGACP